MPRSSDFEKQCEDLVSRVRLLHLWGWSGWRGQWDDEKGWPVHGPVDLIREQRTLWEALPTAKRLFREYIGEEQWQMLRAELLYYSKTILCYKAEGYQFRAGTEHIWQISLVLSPGHFMGVGPQPRYHDISITNQVQDEMKSPGAVFTEFKHIFDIYDIRVLVDVPIQPSPVKGHYKLFPTAYGEHIRREKHILILLDKIMPIEAIAREIVLMARDHHAFEEGAAGVVEEMWMRLEE